MGYTYEELMQKGATPGTPSSAPSGSPKKKYTYEELVSQGATPSVAPVTSQPEKKDGFLKSMVKDAAETLLVKPADRVAEVIGRTGILGKDIKKGYEIMADEGTNRRIFGIDIDQQRGFNEGGLKQIGGEALKTASYLYSGGAAAPAVTTAVRATVPGASRTLFRTGVRDAAKEGAKVGAIGGGAYGAGEEMTQEDSTLGSIVGAGALGAGTGAVTGGAIGTAVPYATKLLNPAERIAKQTKEIEDSMRRSVPHTAKSDPKRDAEITSRVLRDLDIDGAETNADFVRKADERIEAIKAVKEGVINTNPVTRKLDEFNKKVGTENVNHVSEALDQLENQYRKTNSLDKPSAIRVAQLREKAKTQGLTAKELDEIAVMSGRDLNAFNPLTGQLASGANKVAVENTRSGVKQASRDLFDNSNNLIKEADQAISDLIRFKTIRQNRAKAVEAFKSSIVDPTLRQKLQGLITQVVDIATLGSAKGLLTLATKGAVGGPKKLNALDMEKLLAKDLQLIQEASKKGASEAEIISKLQQFIKNNGEKPVLLLEAPKSKPLFATPGGKLTPVAQEAADVASVELGKAKIPKTGPYYQQKVREIQNRLEPYLTPQEMAIIQMGPKTRRANGGLPTASGLPNVYANPQDVNRVLQNKLERYLTPEEMEIIDFGPKPKAKKSLNDIYID